MPTSLRPEAGIMSGSNLHAPEDEIQAALLELANERVAANREKQQLREPLRPTYKEVVDTLGTQGVIVGKQKFCWLKLRRHHFAWYSVGTAAMGRHNGLCIHCGHTKTYFYVGHVPLEPG